jgi:hypothetical protein
MITIRGGIVLPGAGGTTTAADLLMEEALIARIGPPGMEGALCPAHAAGRCEGR